MSIENDLYLDTSASRHALRDVLVQADIGLEEDADFEHISGASSASTGVSIRDDLSSRSGQLDNGVIPTCIVTFYFRKKGIGTDEDWDEYDIRTVRGVMALLKAFPDADALGRPGRRDPYAAAQSGTTRARAISSPTWLSLGSRTAALLHSDDRPALHGCPARSVALHREKGAEAPTIVRHPFAIHRVVVDLRQTAQTQASVCAALRNEPVRNLKEVIFLTKDGLGQPFRP
jgi:hypothetical protein